MRPFHARTPSAALLLAAGGAVALSVACADDPAPPTAAPAAARAAHAAHAGHGGAAARGPYGAETLRDVARLRQATVHLRRLEAGIAAGWATDITGCMSHPSEGGMGHHFAIELPFDATVQLERPELLVYAPGPAGRLELAAVEYVIPVALWTSPEPPELFGQPFHVNEAFGLWVLHVWAWRENPLGLFADWNPKVSCGR